MTLIGHSPFNNKLKQKLSNLKSEIIILEYVHLYTIQYLSETKLIFHNNMINKIKNI